MLMSALEASPQMKTLSSSIMTKSTIKCDRFTRRDRNLSPYSMTFFPCSDLLTGSVNQLNLRSKRYKNSLNESQDILRTACANVLWRQGENKEGKHKNILMHLDLHNHNLPV